MMVEAYDDLIAHLEADFRVLIVEIPGFGFSKVRSSTAYQFMTTVRSIEQALLELNLKNPVLFGPCITGFVAIELVKRGKLNTAGLVLMQTPDFDGMQAWCERMDPKKRLRTTYIGQLAMRFSAKKLSRLWINYATAKAFDTEKIITVTQKVFDDGAAYPLASMYQLWGKELADGDLDTPTLVVWGKQDRSHQDTDSRCSLEHAHEAEIIEFNDCGHFSELENPGAFVERVKPFLTRCFSVN
jgi:pimeloyl-ACP methyl ester carboxylesterase